MTIKKKIKETRGTLVGYKNGNLYNYEDTLLEVSRGSLSAFIKKFEKENLCKVVEIINVKNVDKVYEMDMNTFLEHAKDVTPAPVQEEKPKKDKKQGGSKNELC